MTTPDWKNRLYFGDNLDILRNEVADGSVDLIYLDPPFNSNANYNVLFQEKSGEQSTAQITAFEDTWHWSLESESAYRDVVTNASGKLPALLQAMRDFVGANDMLAYLTMMAQRIVVQVKSGNVSRSQIATLNSDREREKAEIGLFITLRPPTGPMQSEAASAGFYTPEHYPDSRYPRIQILTVEELLSGAARAEYPRVAPAATFRRAQRRRRSAGSQPGLV